MIEIVDNVAKDPINARNIDDLQSGIKSTIAKIMKNKNNNDQETQSNQYEIKVIKQAIIKISALLAIGFGEAGGEIIKEHLKHGHDLNPMMKGKSKKQFLVFVT